MLIVMGRFRSSAMMVTSTPRRIRSAKATASGLHCLRQD
jgi:hypothetical protein